MCVGTPRTASPVNGSSSLSLSASLRVTSATISGLSSCPSWIVAEAHARRADLYLLGDTDIPWVADPVRDRPQARDQLHNDFRTALKEFDVRVCQVRGLKERRLSAALKCIESQETWG